MVALMYDGLELGKFIRDDKNVLRLRLNPNIQAVWLPYIFYIGLDKDMEIVINAWLKERIFPKNRLGANKMLKALGLRRYNLKKIAEITRCSVITDPYWIAYEDTDTYSNQSIRGQIGGKGYPYNSLNIHNEGDYIWRK